MSLVARYIEEQGIPTVIVGSALDIVEHCGVPRYVFTDFPLGNPCGPPWERSTQREIMSTALSLLETARVPRTTVSAPHEWWDIANWRQRYARVDPTERDRLLEIGEARKARQVRLKSA